MTNGTQPTTPSAPLHVHGKEPVALEEIVLDRAAIFRDGVRSKTCIQCGEQPATERIGMRLARGIGHLDLDLRLCSYCADELRESESKIAKTRRISRALFIAQLSALFANMGGFGPSWLVSVLGVSLVASWGVGFVYQKHLRRSQPKLLKIGETTVRLRAPSSWERVLADEGSTALVASTR